MSVNTATGELLEREHELARLDASIAAAAGGDGWVVALEGTAGIGKSALLAEAVRRANDAGMLVLGARGGELEQGFGYGVVRQLFDGPLMAMAQADRDRVLGGAAGLATSALSLAEPGAHDADEPGAVLHGLYWLTANLAAEQPLVVAVDDAHWADAASVAFLSYLSRRVEGLALLVVYATRLCEGCSESLPLVADTGLRGATLRPAELTEDATVELVGRLLGDDSSPEFARACRVATAGNPFLLHELLRALHSDGIAPDAAGAQRVAQIAPGTISRATLARLRRLGAPATRLAFATAVLGKSAELRHASALAALDLESAGVAADALTSAGILAVGRPLQFIHPVVRTTIYAEIPAAQRAASHKRAVLLLEREAVAPADLAPHLMATEPAGDQGIVRRLVAAAEDVRDRGARDAGCAYLERALAEPPRPEDRADIICALGSMELWAARPRAVAHLREALDGDLSPHLEAAAALDLVVALCITESVVEGIDLVDARIAKIAGDGDVEVAMQLEGFLACAAQLSPATSATVRPRLAPYEGRLRGESTGERLLLASMAFDAAHRPGSPERAVELAELAVGGGQMLSEAFGPPGHSANYMLAVWALVCAERLERADELYTRAIERARTTGSLLGFLTATGCRCQVRLRLGRIAEAEAEARTCIEAADNTWVIGRPMLIACVLDAMVEREDLAACHAFLAEHGVDEDMTSIAMASRLLFSRGHLRLAAGDPAGALRDFEQILERDVRSGLQTAAVPTRASAALACAQLGDHGRAGQLARDQLARARAWGTPAALSFALRTAGIVARGEDGLALLAEAAAVVADSPARYERARSLTEYGAALRRAGRRRDAREPLRAALELADRCGARRTAARAREELLATGARPRRAARSGADALTPSERRVCGLAADGLSNRDIAQALFVTVRTVEGHLTQAYMKLGISSREQVADALV